MRAGHSSTLLPMINPGPIDSNRDSLRAGSDSAPVQPGPQAAFVEPLPQCGSPWLDTLLSLRVDGGRPLGAAADPDAFALSSSRQAHEAPAFRFARDAHAGAYVDFAQTREMTAYLARRVRTPDRIVSACGAKSRLWALELLQAGIPKDALRVAAMFVPDVSPQGLERAHATGEIMSAPSRFTDIPFAERLQRGSAIGAHDDESASGFRVGQFEFAFSPMNDGRPGVLIGSRWGVPQRGDSQYSNHFAIAVMTRHPIRGEIEPMVIDLARDRTHPLSLTEWRAAQRFPDAVIATAPFNHRLQIDTRSLSAPQRTRLASLLDAHDADVSTLERMLARESEPERRRITMDFLHAAPKGNVLAQPFGGEAYYQNYAATLSASLEHPMWPALAAMRNRLAMQVMAKRIEREIEPLRVYEQWLAKTEPR